MRIVSGSLKARQLVLPRDSRVRPTTDKLRSAVFSILGGSVVGARVLDGFAGSGALGIEAYSRGAAFVAFVDIDIDAVKKNTAMIETSCCNIIKGNFLNVTLAGGPFDIIFIDPPYGLIASDKILEAINNSNALSEEGVVVYEEFYKTPFTNHEAFNIADERKYGDTAIRFLRRKV